MVKKLSFNTNKKKKFDLLTNKTKLILGIISLITGIIIFVFKPFYVEWFMLLFLIPAIGLIIPNDEIKNSRALGIFTFFIVIIILYTSVNGYLNAYHTLTNLFLTNQISHVPTASEISYCTNTYLIIIIYAVYNIICGIIFFIPTGEEDF